MNEAERNLRSMVDAYPDEPITCPGKMLESVLADLDAARETIDRVECFVDLEIAKIPTVLKGDDVALIYDHIKALLAPPAAPCTPSDCGRGEG